MAAQGSCVLVVRVVAKLEPGGAQLSLLGVACVLARRGHRMRLPAGIASPAGVEMARAWRRAGGDGRRPEAALIARAIFLEASGNSVPDVHWSGPSAGTGPWRGWGRDSMPSSATGQPPRWASHATAMSASRIPFQRSSGGRSASMTARMTERMSNGFLRPGLVDSAKISPTVRRSESGARCGEAPTSPLRGGPADARRRRGGRAPQAARRPKRLGRV